MPRLPVVSAHECISALEKIGFQVKRQKGSHITLIRDNPYRRVTVPNHREIKSGLLRRIIRDAGLTVEEFSDLL